jgi:hypothetical protein
VNEWIDGVNAWKKKTNYCLLGQDMLVVLERQPTCQHVTSDIPHQVIDERVSLEER